MCIDHFLPISSSSAFPCYHGLYTSNAEVQSLDPHKSPRQRCLGWGWGSWQRSPGVKWVWGGHTAAKQKIFRALPLCKERRQSRVKDFDSTHFLNSSILLALQCLWNPNMFLLRCQVSTWRMPQHGGVVHCCLDWWG